MRLIKRIENSDLDYRCYRFDHEEVTIICAFVGLGVGESVRIILCFNIQDIDI